VFSEFTGVIYGLLSALFYGGADFYGGFATRRLHQYQVLVLSSFTGALVLLVLAFVRREGLPPASSLIWASLGGLAGVLGLAALYLGLSTGSAAIVSPVAGVVGAALPVIFAALTAGLPGPTQIAGFTFALPGIWLTTLAPAHERSQSQSGLQLGALAGLGFGIFFICVANISGSQVFAPLAVSKLVSGGIAVCLLLITRRKMPSPAASPVAILVGMLDPLANVFYLLSSQYIRLDVAAVLASLYPAGTVLLAGLVYKSQIAPLQWLGVALCLVSIALIIA
jgi:drug/metabolite transporter (DMT)-like permease